MIDKYFVMLFFPQVRRNFLRSLAAYSVVSYILNIKDRHNGNILIHEDGFLIHIGVLNPFCLFLVCVFCLSYFYDLLFAISM